MRIGIDFDRTLFDTDSFKEHLENRFPGFSDTYSQAKQHDVYRPAKHAELMEVELNEIFSEMQNCSSFVYDDVDELQKLKKAGHSLFLISRGDEELQRLKIRGSDVEKYFDNVKIISESIDQVPKDKAIDIDILVDDRDKELQAVNIETVKTDSNSKQVAKTVEKIQDKINESQTV